jgi:CheY-like chemotaxis protein
MSDGNGTSTMSIAIVDDELAVRVSLRRLCNALGFEATIYASGLALLDAIDQPDWQAHCILLDFHMAEMNGLELQRHLRNRHVRVPTIMVTADDAPEARARCLAAGASAFLRKPIGADELLAALDHAVHRA